MQALYVMLATHCQHVAARRCPDHRDERRLCINKSRRYVHRIKCKAISLAAHGSNRRTKAGAKWQPGAQQLTGLIKRSQNFQDLTNTCAAHWDALNHIHIAAALSAGVKLPGACSASAAPLLDALTALFTHTHTLARATIREVATVLWALAKIGRAPPSALLDALLEAAQDPSRHTPLLRDASPQALSNILWSLASWGTRGPDPLLQLLLESGSEALPLFQPQDTATVLWALARLMDQHSPTHPPRWGPPPAFPLQPPALLLLPGLLAAAADQAREMSPQGLAMSVWACTKLQVPHNAFLPAAVTAFQTQLPVASPTDIALFTASLAQRRFRCPVLLRAVAERCCCGGAGSSDTDSSIESGNRGESGSDVRHRRSSGIRSSGGGSGSADGGAEGQPGRGQVTHGSCAADGASACESWSPLCRQRLLWAFAALEFRHGPAVRALLGLRSSDPRVGGSGRPDGGDDDAAAAAAGGGGGAGLGSAAEMLGGVNWIWEPGGLRYGNGGEDEGVGGVGGGGDEGASAALGASSLIWALGKLGCGRTDGPERRAVEAAAEALWAARRDATLSHLAAAAWGLQQLGIQQGRLLQLAGVRLTQVLERAATATITSSSSSSNSSSSRSRSISSVGGRVLAGGTDPRVGTSALERPAAPPDLVGSGEVSPGELDAAVMVLWCLGRQRTWPRSATSSPDGTTGRTQPPAGSEGEVEVLVEGARLGEGEREVGATGEPGEAAVGRVLDAFAAASHRLLPRLSPRQLPLVCCAFVRLGRTDPSVLGLAAELLEGKQVPAAGYAAAAAAAQASVEVGTRGSVGGLMGRLTRNGLAMTLWALVSSGQASPQLMQLAAEEVMRRFPPLSAAAAAQVAVVVAEKGAEEAEEEAGAEEEFASQDTGIKSRTRRTWSGLTEGRAAAEGGGAVSGTEPGAASASAGPASAAATATVTTEAGMVTAPWAALTLWAFAAADCYNAVLYDTLLSYVVRKVSRLGPGRVAMVLWACAVAGHYRRDVVEVLSGALTEAAWALPPASFTQANWAVAHLTAGVCLTWRGPAAPHLASLGPSLSRHQAAVLLWSLAVQQLVLAAQDRRKFVAEVDLLLERLETAPAAAEEEPDGTDAAAVVAADPQATHAHPEAPLEPGVALIAAEALALLMASPIRAVSLRVAARLGLKQRPSGTEVAVPAAAGPSSSAAASEPALPQSTSNASSSHEGAGAEEVSPGSAGPGDRAATGPTELAAGGGCGGSRLTSQLLVTWQRALRRRHPQQAAVAAAARQLGYCPRLLRTHGAFPLALPSSLELPDAAPRPAVLLLAERSDFAVNEVGQPLGPLFTTVQLLKERGWLVAVVVAEQFAGLRLPSRQARHLRQLLAAAGVHGAARPAPCPGAAAANPVAAPAVAAATAAPGGHAAAAAAHAESPGDLRV